MEYGKAIIDFSKTVIGLATSVLTIVLGLVIVGQLESSTCLLWTIGLLIFAVFISLFAFGGGIALVKATAPDASKEWWAAAYGNVAATAMIVGVALLVFTPKSDEMSIDDILAKIQSSTKSMSRPFQPTKCQSIKRTGDNYEVTYVDGTVTGSVVFSVKEKKITEIR